jgi:hypothetical protein
VEKMRAQNKSGEFKNVKSVRSKKTNNQRKRFKYARCLESFKECPKKLADVIINNDVSFLEPANQPPEAEEVRKLHEDLWGTAGPPNPIVSGRETAMCQIRETSPPVTDNEIGGKIKKLKNKTAAGPDVLQKKHLQILGLPIVIAKIFNILCYCFYFPTKWEENRTTLIPKANKGVSKVENWKPITIGPVLGRMFSSYRREVKKGHCTKLKAEGLYIRKRM